MGQGSAGTYLASPSTLSKRGSHLCNDVAASVLIRSDNDAVASPLIGISATMLSHLLLRSQPRWKVCADAQSGRAATASQSAEMQGSGEPLARSGTSKGEAPRITSTQPQSLREGHRASDTWWNHLPSPGYMILYKDELSLCGS